MKRGEKKRREAPKNNIVKPHDNDDGLSTRVHTYTCVHIYIHSGLFVRLYIYYEHVIGRGSLFRTERHSVSSRSRNTQPLIRRTVCTCTRERAASPSMPARDSQPCKQQTWGVSGSFSPPRLRGKTHDVRVFRFCVELRIIHALHRKS